MNEYTVVETPSAKNRFGFRKRTSRLSAELSAILNKMGSEKWDYCGDRMDGKLMVFSRKVPVLSNENQSDVARALVTTPLDAPIVVRRPRPTSVVTDLPAEFQSRQSNAGATGQDNIVALGS